jgi:type III secretion protein C
LSIAIGLPACPQPALRTAPAAGAATRWRANMPAWCFVCAVAWFALLSWATPARAADVPWPAQRIELSADNEPLNQFLLRFFARLRLPAIASDLVTGRVSGNFNQRPEVLFRELADSYGLTWYFDGSTVHIYSLAEIESRLLTLDPATAARFNKLLADLRIADPRFPVRVSASDGYVSVSGPPRFVARVEEIAAFLESAMGRAGRPQAVRTFRLRHAWAADRKVVIGGTETLIPGVASLLQAVLNDQAGSAVEDGSGTRVLPANTPGLLGKGLSALGRAGAAAPPATAASSAGPMMQADTLRRANDRARNEVAGVIRPDARLNAVVVRDAVEKMSMYEELIRALDQPVPLIEIEATVVDISSERAQSLGAEFSFLLSNRPSGVSPPVIGLDTNNYNPAVQPRATVLLGNDRNFFFAQINALQTEGDAAVQSKPRVLTMDNNEAVLSSTQEFFVRVPGKDVADLFNVSVGLTLRVTPSIVMDAEKVRIKLHRVADRQRGRRAADQPLGDQRQRRDRRGPEPVHRRAHLGGQCQRLARCAGHLEGAGAGLAVRHQDAADAQGRTDVFVDTTCRQGGHAMSEAVKAALLLCVLSGRQSQVQTTLADGNYLLGNDELSCDIVLDLGLPERHTAYLRIEGDRLTLLPIAGDAWLGERHLDVQQPVSLMKGEVFTLGRVSLAIAPGGFDFSRLQLPAALRKAGDTPELAAVALPPRSPSALRAAGVFRAALLGTCALSVTAALVWGSGAVSAQRDPDAMTAAGDLQRLDAQLNAEPQHELRVVQDESTSQLVVEGYVPDTEALARLERTLQHWPQAALLRVHPVAPLQHSLERRFVEVMPAAELSYLGDGAFETRATSQQMDALREAAERALKDLPGVKAVHVVLSDVTVRESGEPARLSLARSATRQGQVVVSGSAAPWPPAQPERPRFAEIRWGEVPSVLTRQGERLFAGARLADGGVISRIERNAVFVSRAGAERAEPVGSEPEPETVAEASR